MCTDSSNVVVLGGRQIPAEMEFKVPGSIANLGPGFDVLAVAVQVYLTLKVQAVPGKDKLTFEFMNQHLDGENYIERAFRFLLRQNNVSFPSVHVQVYSDIPMKGGLGSSAAATVAGLRLFEALTHPLPEQGLLNAACALEGHPDNVSAAIFGGLTASCQLGDGSVYSARLRWPEALACLVLTPEMTLATSASRGVLPHSLSRADAVFNMQRIALLLQTLQSGNYSLLREALQDRIHQPYRQSLVPGLEEAIALDHPDILGVCLSGAGPSIVAFAENNLEDVVNAMSMSYKRTGIPFRIRTLFVHQGPEDPKVNFQPSSCCV